MNPVFSDNVFLPFAWINSNYEVTKANNLDSHAEIEAREQTCSGQYMGNLY